MSEPESARTTLRVFRHRYRAFGLSFGCDQELPNWPRIVAGEQVDVHLRLRCGLDVEEQEELGPAWGDWALVLESPHRDAAGVPLVRVEERAGFRRFLYHDGARFFVDPAGREAWLGWPAEMSLEAIWLYFSGPVMTWILRLHGRVVLHAAAVELGGKAVLLAGPSGAGKSTTAAALALAGHGLLSDDSAALASRAESDEVMVWPDSPRLRLWPDSAPAFDDLDVAALPLLCDGWEKRAFDSARFEPDPRPIVAVYCLQPGAETTFSPLSARQALPVLIAHAAAAELANREMRRREFELLSELALKVPVVAVARQDGQSLVPALLADLEQRVAVRV